MEIQVFCDGVMECDMIAGLEESLGAILASAPRPLLSGTLQGQRSSGACAAGEQAEPWRRAEGD